MIDVSAVVEAVDAAYCEAGKENDRGTQSLYDVASSLRRAVESQPIAGHEAILAALEYHLDHEKNYVPMMAMGGRVYPPPLDRMEEVDPEAFAVWEATSMACDAPLVKARLCDLLWEVKFGRTSFALGQQAVDSYLAAADGDFGGPLEISDGLQRALEISLRLGDERRIGSVLSSTVSAIRADLDGTEHIPGVSLSLLDVMAKLKASRRPVELGGLLDAAYERYADNAWLRESIQEMRARLAPPEDRQVIWRDAAEGFVDLARRNEGLVKYAHLAHAVELADLHGLRDLAEELRVEMQGISEEELDLKTISVEVPVPTEMLNELIKATVGDDCLENAFLRFGGQVLTGEHAANVEFMRRMMQEHPFRYLVTNLHIGPENSLLRKLDGDDSREEQALIEHETQTLLFSSVLAVRILAGMRERYGNLGAGSEWFSGGMIEPIVARRIGRALELFDARDFDSAASVLAPRIERIIRGMAGAIGMSITSSPDRRGHPGGVKGLGEILKLLRLALPVDSYRYLRALLSEVTSLNLRNRIGHGLVDEVGEGEVALLIHAACHLRSLTPNGQAPGE